MKVIYNNDSVYLFRLDRGEEVLEKLQQFCAENEIYGGSFSGLGAAQEVTLADYDLEKKEYRTADYTEVLEIASLTGNVALNNGAIMPHAHGVFSTLAKVHAGHVMRLIVGGTCEITLTAFPGKVERKQDDQTGLKLLA